MPECNRPHQSDMEQKYEIWVHDLITFLHANDVKTYEGDWNANTLEGMNSPKGKTLEPSVRLNIFQATLHTRAREMQNLRDRLGAETIAHLKTEARLKTAEDMLEELWSMLHEHSGAVRRESIIERLETILRERRPVFLEPELPEESRTMSNLEGREVIGCKVCGLKLEPAPGEYGHRKDIDCIKALRLANKEQKEVAQRLSLSLSTRFFAILEELAHDPECGVQYYTCDKDTGEKTLIGCKSVKGVMTAIFQKFQEMGDWSLMQTLQKELKDEQELNRRYEYVLGLVEGQAGDLELDIRRQVELLLHPDREPESPT